MEIIELVSEPVSRNGQKINLRSEAAKEIILKKKGFFSTWALPLFLLLLLVLFSCTWFIRYPDIIQTNAALTAGNAAKEINVRQSGKLVRLFAGNDNKITENGIIGWIESIADHKEVIRLSQLLDQSVDLIYANQTEKISPLFSTWFRNLGELQPSYQQFLLALQQFNDYLINGYYQKRKSILVKDFNFLKEMNASLLQQKGLLQQDLLLTQESVNANDSLYSEKVISKQDMRIEKSKLLTKQMNLPQIESSLLTNENQQREKQKEIEELEHTISQQKIIFQQVLQTLKSAVDDWMKKYVITAPTSGKVVFIVPLQENQFLQAGRTIGFVNPEDSRYYAQVNLPQNNFGKIGIGQRVQLRFDAYPYPEFGFVEGKLNYISKVPSDSGFLATIELPNGLTTNYKKEIQYHNGLRCQALIITKDTRLFQRFYYSIVKGVQR